MYGGHGIQEVSGLIPLISTKSVENHWISTLFSFSPNFLRNFRPLEFRSNLMHSRGVVMARISMRNVQKSSVSEYFDLYLSSAAARGVKDKLYRLTRNQFIQRFDFPIRVGLIFLTGYGRNKMRSR